MTPYFEVVAKFCLVYYCCEAISSKVYLTLKESFKQIYEVLKFTYICLVPLKVLPYLMPVVVSEPNKISFMLKDNENRK